MYRRGLRCTAGHKVRRRRTGADGEAADSECEVSLWTEVSLVNAPYEVGFRTSRAKLLAVMGQFRTTDTGKVRRKKAASPRHVE